jgi:hypothetical protein
LLLLGLLLLLLSGFRTGTGAAAVAIFTCSTSGLRLHCCCPILQHMLLWLLLLLL